MDGTEEGTTTQPAGRQPGGAGPGTGPRWPMPLPRLRLSLAERRLLLPFGDVLALNASLLLLLARRSNYAFSWRTLTLVPHYFVLLTALWFAWAFFFDCYEPPATADASVSAWRTVRAGLLAGLCYLATPFITPQFPASRLSTYLFLGLATASVPVWRLLYATVFVQPVFQRRVLIVGAGRSGAALGRVLAATPQEGNPYAGSGYLAVGFVDDDPAKAGAQVEGLPVLGNRYDLRRLVDQYRVDIVVVAITDTDEIQPDLLQSLLDCRERGLRLVPMTVLYEELTGRVPVGHAGGRLSVVLPMEDPATHRPFQAIKRLCDWVVGAVGVIATVLLAPWVALANALYSPGPLFYWQTRVGRGGRAFRLVKFRSMIPQAEAEGRAVWACRSDPRVTPVGRILRRARLDELPQMWNVLKGEMSVVGPRPERPELVIGLVAEVPWYQARHAVRPGITGWAQVRYPYGSSVQDAWAKLEYDLYYIKHQGLYLELSILAKTAAVMLGLQGR